MGGALVRGTQESHSYVWDTGTLAWVPWDGAISASITGVDGAITDGVSALIKATVKDYTNSNPLCVVNVDTNGDPASGGGAGTEYTEDNAAAANPVGGQVMLRRRDTLTASEVTTDGDVIAANATAKGELYIYQAPPTASGLSSAHLVAAGSTNQTNIKASAGHLYGIRVFNNAAYPVYVKFHNTAGTPTAGAGVVYTVGVQAGTQRDVVIPFGREFTTGIALSIVKDLTDAGTTAVTASDCVVDVDYK